MIRALRVEILVVAALMPLQGIAAAAMAENNQTAYYWKATEASESAQLLTLFCKSCSVNRSDVPLVAVLRDRLAANDRDGVTNDRLTDVWLLSYSPLTLYGRLLGAVPFFYWRVGQGSSSVPRNSLKPFMDLTAPEHPVVSGVGRDLLQTMMLDTTFMPIRASSRAYRSNEVDRERRHLEVVISYLRAAPTGEEANEITNAQRDFLLARLELRKRLLGGLVADRDARRVGEEAGFEQERVRSRNWESLRECAEKTGLSFEPINVAGIQGQYALLWFSPTGSKPQGNDLGPMWKVLNLRNPWTDNRLRNWKGPYKVLDDGSGAHGETLIPLGVYSLNYPLTPLLLVDFRDNLHLRKYEMAQRTINEIVSGVIGLSHFTNWYFYAGAFAYDFVVARHGTATNQGERLDSYSSFRTALALDHSLDPKLRSEMERRMDSIAVNPLDGSPAREVELAQSRFQVLEEEAKNGKLAQHVDEQRRAELAGYGRGHGSEVFQVLLHAGSFGLYTKRAKPDADNLEALRRNRQMEANLELLDRLTESGGRPELVFDSLRIQNSVKELASSLSYATERGIRAHAERTLKRLQVATQDASVQQECGSALNLISPKEMNIAASVRAAAPLHSIPTVK
jgi:hypothetical protein